MEPVESLTELLVNHGPWAIVAIETVVIWRMALYIQAMQTRHQATVKQLLLDHNKEQREETKQLVTAMTLTEKSLQSMNDTLSTILQRRH